MEKIIKKEIILEGLSCAHCAAKIESEVAKIRNINQLSLNFIEKTLSFEIKNENDVDQTLNTINNVIKNIEPDIEVKEKIYSRLSKKVLIITGLCCRSCTEKIEKEVRSISGVKGATFDFDKGKLVIEFLENKNEKEIVSETKRISKEIISGIKIRDEEFRNEVFTKVRIIRTVFGIIIFTAALLIKTPEIYTLSLFIISYILISFEIIFKAFRNIFKGQFFDESTLMTVATIGAFFIKEYPEAISVMLFYKAGLFFQNLAINNSRKSIKSLLNVMPNSANLKIGNDIKTVSPEDVKVGDIIIVKPGEKVPLDGMILDGSSNFDTASLTGESLLKELKTGDNVLAGFINKNGVITVKVEKEFKDSQVKKILELVENSTSKKSKTENFISKFARIYTPVVLGIALLLVIIPTIFISSAMFNDWIYRALIFLVASCPCALVISIPLGFFGGIGSASRKGILIKGSNYLEGLNSVDTVIFDKTGTLTEGSFKITKIAPENGVSDDELLEYAANAEIYSNHPIAYSIISKYKGEIDKTKINYYDELSGYGIKAEIGDDKILCGNEKLMIKEEIDFKRSNDLGTICYLAKNKVFIGFIVISDNIKKESAQTIKRLKDFGITNFYMLTGDNKKSADSVGKILGIENIKSDLLPEQKVLELENIEKNKKVNSRIMFAGDGINDAPVIARSDIGVALGGLGNDAAIESADIVLINGKIEKLPEVFKIAKYTRKIVLQNIFFALGVKALVLTLGALGFATMWEAVFADVGVTLIAVLNAVRVMRKK